MRKIAEIPDRGGNNEQHGGLLHGGIRQPGRRGRRQGRRRIGLR
jgi:hypothetical protein